MKTVLLSMIMALSLNLQARDNSHLNAEDINNAPKSFERDGKKFDFVDFKLAQYHVKYDVAKQTATAESEIEFEARSEAFPIFDLVPSATEIELDGEKVSSFIVRSPENATSYISINKQVASGRHVLKIKNNISNNLRFQAGGVLSSFWMSDLNDRQYLEQYLPANLEFDRHKSILTVEFINSNVEQRIFTNGQVEMITPNLFRIEFPEYFTSSSYYFHTAYKGRFDEKTIGYQTLDGRQIKITVYRDVGQDLNSFLNTSVKVLNELEKDYGPWHHNDVTIYGAGMGGMEYCGATMTSFSALGHELIHSYFARGVMPAHGNSGWIDEAIASWRDNSYPRSRSVGFSASSMAAHSNYRRFTDRDAYTKGAKFMAFLDSQLADQGGLKAFLKVYKDKWLFTPMFTENFIQDLEAHSQMEFEKLFKDYVYAKPGSGWEKSQESGENPHHPRLSAKFYYDLL
jgi:hypothetical protein